MTNKEELLQIITKLENLEEERANIAQNVTDTLSEAKIKGYDIKILKQILKLRKMDDDDRMRQEEELESYNATIGMK
jgi:uncharacterized protein (UPF0335 family)